MVEWHGPHGDHCCLAKFQHFDFVGHNSPAPLAFIMGLAIIPFLWGSFVRALKDENVYNGSSLNKIMLWKKKIPTTMEQYSVITPPVPIHINTKLLGNLDE